MQKIILYYKFVPINDTESVMYWQRALCEQYGLEGRILISKHGINGTLGGDIKKLKYYTRAMKAHSLFDRITYKWSDGGNGALMVLLRPTVTNPHESRRRE